MTDPQDMEIAVTKALEQVGACSGSQAAGFWGWYHVCDVGTLSYSGCAWPGGRPAAVLPCPSRIHKGGRAMAGLWQGVALLLRGAGSQGAGWCGGAGVLGPATRPDEPRAGLLNLQRDPVDIRSSRSAGAARPHTVAPLPAPRRPFESAALRPCMGMA